MKTPFHIRHALRSGFTLPEVIIAISISALGLVSLLGIIPQSLDTLRKSAEVSSESRIAQQIFAQVSTSEWQDVTGRDQLDANFQGRRFYFDELAVELDDAKSSFGPAFVAEVSVAPSDVALPQGSGSAAPDPHLRRVTVKVATSASTSFDFTKAKAGAYRTYASVVTRTGR